MLCLTPQRGILEIKVKWLENGYITVLRNLCNANYRLGLSAVSARDDRRSHTFCSLYTNRKQSYRTMRLGLAPMFGVTTRFPSLLL